MVIHNGNPKILGSSKSLAIPSDVSPNEGSLWARRGHVVVLVVLQALHGVPPLGLRLCFSCAGSKWENQWETSCVSCAKQIIFDVFL